GTDPGTGNHAFVTGATLIAGRDVRITAEEHIDTALNTSFTFNFLSTTVGDYGFLTTNGNAVASIEAGSTVTATTGDVIVNANVNDLQSVLSSSLTSGVTHTSTATITGSTATAGDDVLLDATATTDAQS